MLNICILKLSQNDGWTESRTVHEQTLTFNHKNEEIAGSLFFEKMNEVCELQMTSQEYIPITLSEDLIQTLSPEEVNIILILF